MKNGWCGNRRCIPLEQAGQHSFCQIARTDNLQGLRTRRQGHHHRLCHQTPRPGTPQTTTLETHQPQTCNIDQEPCIGQTFELSFDLDLFVERGQHDPAHRCRHFFTRDKARNRTGPTGTDHVLRADCHLPCRCGKDKGTAGDFHQSARYTACAGFCVKRHIYRLRRHLPRHKADGAGRGQHPAPQQGILMTGSTGHSAAALTQTSTRRLIQRPLVDWSQPIGEISPKSIGENITFSDSEGSCASSASNT